MHNTYLSFVKLPNGNLEISFCGSLEDREDFQEKRKERGSASVWADMIESHSTNGSYYHFDPSNGHPFVGITSCMDGIAESMDFPDDGDPEIVGDCWINLLFNSMKHKAYILCGRDANYARTGKADKVKSRPWMVASYDDKALLDAFLLGLNTGVTAGVNNYVLISEDDARVIDERVCESLKESNIPLKPFV